jgi:hypothetical protein
MMCAVLALLIMFTPLIGVMLVGITPSSLFSGMVCVGVWSHEGPKPTSECCVSLIWMVMQGEYTGIYPGSGKRRP